MAGHPQDEPLVRLTGMDTLRGLSLAIFCAQQLPSFPLLEEAAPLTGVRPQLRFAHFPVQIVVCLVSVFLLGSWMTLLDLSDYFGHEMTWRYFPNVTAWSLGCPSARRV